MRLERSNLQVGSRANDSTTIHTCNQNIMYQMSVAVWLCGVADLVRDWLWLVHVLAKGLMASYNTKLSTRSVGRDWDWNVRRAQAGTSWRKPETTRTGMTRNRSMPLPVCAEPTLPPSQLRRHGG